MKTRHLLRSFYYYLFLVNVAVAFVYSGIKDTMVRNDIRLSVTPMRYPMATKSFQLYQQLLPHMADNTALRSNLTDIPLLIFINKKSGGKRGASLLQSLKTHLALAEICDLEEYCAISYLERVKDLPKVRIIVCGGDGTVGRIMDEWKNIASATTETEFGIIPLGTGNDMFKQLVKQYRRMTKYQMPAMYCRKPADELGVKIISYSSPKVLKANPSDIYRLFRHPVVVPLDRWLVSVKTPSELPSSSSSSSSGSSTSSSSTSKFSTTGSTMNNYFGIGVDGAVSLAFDKLRQKLPFLFFHRNMNKVWYAAMGTVAFVTRGNPDISNLCKLTCDGEDMTIPKGTQGLIVLNINSYAGGTRLWPFRFRSREYYSPSIADGILEVVAVKGVLHLGLIKTGLSQATPLGQGHDIRITTMAPLHMQIDGEPSVIEPATVQIDYAGRTRMMIPNEELL